MTFPDIPLMWTSLQGTNIIGMGKVLQLGLVKTAMVCGEQINRDESGSIKPTRKGTWWLIPLSKWVITPVINGISKVNPLITGVITHLLSGMSHQVYIYIDDYFVGGIPTPLKNDGVRQLGILFPIYGKIK